MIFGHNIIKQIGQRFYEEDNSASSHWRYYHQFLELDANLQVKKTMGFGEGSKSNRLIANLAHYVMQYPFRKLFSGNHYFKKLSKISLKNSKTIGIRFSLDVLRQVMTIAYLKEKGLIQPTNVAIVIGDGFSSLTSLLITAGVCQKVIMVNLTKTLFVDVSSALMLPEFSEPTSITLVQNQDEMKEAISNDEVKIIALEAQNYDVLQYSEATLAFNIASMQEMDMVHIEGYFDQLRILAKKNELYFYCCNRESKFLPDKSEISFRDYPWSKEDHYYFDELCPWHLYYYSCFPPIYKKYDGPLRHRFSKLYGN